MPAYVTGQIDVHDPDSYRADLDGLMPSFRRHGGELLVTSSAETEVLEGDWARPRTVVLRFRSVEDARAWRSNPDYVALSELRHRAERTNLVLVAGVA